MENMPVKYIPSIHIQMTGPLMTFLFGNGVGRHNATRVRESWPWGRVADMTKLEWAWRRTAPREEQGRPRLRKEAARATRATRRRSGARTRPWTQPADSREAALQAGRSPLLTAGRQATTGEDCRPLDLELSMIPNRITSWANIEQNSND